MTTNVHLVKAMGFPVVMYGYECWTIKKAQCQRIDAFKLWCWRRLLRVPWTARKLTLNAGLMLKLKLQCFNHLMWRTNSLEKTLMLGKIEGRRRREWQTVKWLDANSMDMSLGKLREIVKDREACLAAIHRVTKNEAWLEAEQQQHFAMRGCRGRKKAGDGIYQRLRREQKKT